MTELDIDDGSIHACAFCAPAAMLEAITREATSQVRPYMTKRPIDDIARIDDVAERR